MNYRNSFDRTGQCSQMGDKAETSFSRILAKKGEIREASRFEQMKHVDFVLTDANKKTLKYEVKARKRVNRGDDEVDDTTVYIEFLNVRGDLGWLYGQADFVAFERKDDFLIVDRLKLREMAEAKCDLAIKVGSASECLYKGYTRFGRKDLLSRVLMSDIEAIAKEIWKK